MGRTVRLYIDLDEAQAEALRRRATELGISEQELLLRGVDMADRSEESKAAWERHMALVRERLAMKLPQTGRDWTREDLYDE